MKALIPLLITLLIIASPAPTSQSLQLDYTDIAKQIRPSIVHLTMIQKRQHPLTGEIVEVASSCTVWALRIDGTFVGADHCAKGRDHKIEEHPTQIVFQDEELDLAIFRAEGIQRPILEFGEEPKTGSVVLTYGYGYGLDSPILHIGYVANARAPYPEEPGEWMTLDHPFINGMSGAPIVDTTGRVVGVAVQSNETTGWSRPVGDIKKALKKFR